jgi:hypothetical protein
MESLAGTECIRAGTFDRLGVPSPNCRYNHSTAASIDCKWDASKQKRLRWSGCPRFFISRVLPFIMTVSRTDIAEFSTAVSLVLTLFSVAHISEMAASKEPSAGGYLSGSRYWSAYVVGFGGIS